MVYGLKNNIIEKINNVFSNYPEIEQVILYGSRAKGNYRIGSDIDLTFTGKNITLKLLYKIENDLDELNLPFTFDISIFSHIKNKQLIEHIQRVGKILYSKGSFERIKTK